MNWLKPCEDELGGGDGEPDLEGTPVPVCYHVGITISVCQIFSDSQLPGPERNGGVAPRLTLYALRSTPFILEAFQEKVEEEVLRMPTVAVKLSLEDLSSVLEHLSESEMRKILERIRDRRKKIILEQGYRQLGKLTFEDIGSEEEWVRVENEAIENLERELS